MIRPAAMAIAAALALASVTESQEADVPFKVTARLVEVYATVLDPRGRHVDHLAETDFRVFDNGEPQRIVSFESSATRLSCAILLDTTASMLRALPRVRSAIYRLIGQFRDEDPVAVYGFSTAVELLQDFTTDRIALRQAVSRTRAEGSTALFDAISRVALKIAATGGKKAIVVFTDGADNSSLLNARSAVDRAKKFGIPVYTVAEGEALQRATLLHELKELARLTNGKSYAAKSLTAIDGIFADISEELQHTYWIAFQPPVSPDGAWRSIRVAVTGGRGHKVQAREGYLPY